MKNEQIGCWLKRVAISACAGTFVCVFALPAAAAAESASGEEALLPLVPYPQSVRLGKGAVGADHELRVVSETSRGSEGYRLSVRPDGVNVARASLPASGQSSRPLHVCYRSFYDQLERTGDFHAGGVMEHCFFAARSFKTTLAAPDTKIFSFE